VLRLNAYLPFLQQPLTTAIFDSVVLLLVNREVASLNLCHDGIFSEAFASLSYEQKRLECMLSKSERFKATLYVFEEGFNL
jgi:hypothetical protein